jgi:hypothetical protein
LRIVDFPAPEGPEMTMGTWALRAAVSIFVGAILGMEVVRVREAGVEVRWRGVRIGGGVTREGWLLRVPRLCDGRAKRWVRIEELLWRLSGIETSMQGRSQAPGGDSAVKLNLFVLFADGGARSGIVG